MWFISEGKGLPHTASRSRQTYLLVTDSAAQGGLLPHPATPLLLCWCHRVETALGQVLPVGSSLPRGKERAMQAQSQLPNSQSAQSLQSYKKK